MIIFLSIAILAAFAISLFSRKLLLYENYELSQINVSNDSIQISGGFGGASGIGYDSYDYTIKDDNLYLKIYQQSIFSSKPMNGKIEIKIDGDFTKLKGIYVVQSKGESINIWSSVAFSQSTMQALDKNTSNNNYATLRYHC